MANIKPDIKNPIGQKEISQDEIQEDVESTPLDIKQSYMLDLRRNKTNGTQGSSQQNQDESLPTSTTPINLKLS